MKFLIIGLGNFGRTLAEELTDRGHEVIGIDTNEQRVDVLKDRIAVAYIMDATEHNALRALPLAEIYCAVVAIGHSMDNSLRTVAALKEQSVPTIYARALDNTHQQILNAMNIASIFIPESLAATMLAAKWTAPTPEPQAPTAPAK
ncbi:MAG: TrkA family potassium uptake protein [Tidjanibacter sp.]|nr:TrkA family potassium uptake protein [Tidjanibacter sp.]